MKGTQLLQYIAPPENNGFAQIYANDWNTLPTEQVVKTCVSIWTMKCTSEQNWTISSPRAHEYFRLLRYISWNTNVNKNEHESLLFWCLMLSLENQRVAGYMLAGDRSMLLETDGSLAWLYHYPLVHSQLHTRNQCYDRYSTRAKFSLLTLLPGRRTQRLTYKIVLIGSKTSFVSTWTKKTHGIH